MSIENGKQPAFPNSSLETAFGSTGLSKFEYAAIQFMAANRIAHPDQIGEIVANQAIWDAKCLFEKIAESEVQNG